MHWWCFTKNTINQRPITLLFTTCGIVICIMTWFGIANLQATENNSDDETQTTDVVFQNDAQTQHAENIAKQVTLQDPDAKTREEIIQEICDMRSSGMGWGEIAKHFGLHPSILGLGHSKSKHKHTGQISKQLPWKTELQEATARSFKGGIAPGHGVSGSETRQNKLGMMHIKGYRINQRKGLAVGHTKDKDGNRAGSRGGGQSGDHGNGRGGGHGGGEK